MHHLRRIATFTALCTAGALSLLVGAGSASALPANCGYSTQGYGGNFALQLSPGQFCLSSPDRRHYIVFQSDGNLVLYSTLGGTSHATWSSGTVGRAKYLIPQTDGNFVLYGLDYFGHRQAVWNSGTAGWSGNQFTLDMQNDGNFVIYNDGPFITGSRALWSTKTNGR